MAAFGDVFGKDWGRAEAEFGCLKTTETPGILRICETEWKVWCWLRER